MIYQFGETARRYSQSLDAQKIGERLEQLRQHNNGELIKTDIIEAARPESSPLHGAFTWDDTKAAHQFRLNEARQLVRAIVTMDDESGEEVRAFWPVRLLVTNEDDEPRAERYYQSVKVISQHPQEYQSALKMALMELESAEITLQQLKRIAPQERHGKIEKATEHILTAHDLLYQPQL